jgi:hypothetical protein
MELDRFLNLLATVFGGIGSIYVLKAIASLSPDLIARLSSTYVTFSLVQIDSLAKQKADSTIGIALLAFALLIAVVNSAFVPPSVRFVDWCTAIALVAGLAIVAVVCLALVGRAIHRSQKRAVGRLITKDWLQKRFESKRLTMGDVPSLRVYAHTVLELPVADSESSRQLLERVATAVGVDVPEGFDFTGVDNK